MNTEIKLFINNLINQLLLHPDRNLILKINEKLCSFSINPISYLYINKEIKLEINNDIENCLVIGLNYNDNIITIPFNAIQSIIDIVNCRCINISKNNDNILHIYNINSNLLNELNNINNIILDKIHNNLITDKFKINVNIIALMHEFEDDMELDIPTDRNVVYIPSVN